MGNYNFEDENKNFGETVRLDDIREEVCKTENLENTKEFEFIDENDNAKGRKNYKGHKSRGMVEKSIGNNVIKLSIIGGVIIFVLIFAVAFVYSRGGYTTKPDTGDLPSNPENKTDISGAITKSDSIYAVVKEADKEGTISIYSINDKVNMSLIINEDTVLTGRNGGKISYAEIKEGEVIVVTEKGDTGIAESIKIPSDVWRQDGVTGVEIDITTNTIKFDAKTYLYGEDTYFAYDSNIIFPGDVKKVDTVTLIGLENMIFSVRVEKGHGFLTFKNEKMVENMEVYVDGTVVKMNENMGIVELAIGSHIVTISGTNIEDYIVGLNTEDKMKSDIDLSKARKKSEEKGIVDLNVNVKDYSVMVNGKRYIESDTILQVPYGIVKIAVEKNGYEKWSTSVTVSENPTSLDVVLKEIGKPPAEEKKNSGNLTIYSSPGWAKIYVDSVYKGVAPIMVNLPYGDYEVTAVHENYDDTVESVTIDGPDETVTINLE